MGHSQWLCRTVELERFESTPSELKMLISRPRPTISDLDQNKEKRDLKQWIHTSVYYMVNYGELW